MAITAGDSVLFGGVFPSNDVDVPPIGGSIANGSGSFIVFAGAGGGSGVSNMGGNVSGDPAMMREMRPGTSGLFGKAVQLTGKGPFFRGVVILASQIELSTSGGTGALTECVLVVNSEGFRFLALASAVEEVA